MIDLAYTNQVGVMEARRNGAAEICLRSAYHKYSSALYRYALALTGSAEDAQDAVQEVFTRMSQDGAKLSEVHNIRAYLYTATRNTVYSILRNKKRRDVLHEAICLDLATACIPQMKQTSATIMLIRSSLADLAVEQREVLVLKILNQMTFKEIADTMGTSINTVAGRYRYGIMKLRAALEAANNA